MHRRVIFCRRKVFAASDQCAIQSKSPPRSLNPAKLQDFFKYQPTVPGELPEWRMRSSQTKTISESLAASRLSSVRTPPKNRQSKRAVLTRPDSSIKAAPSVFLNIPYDQGFSDLYLAYIAGAAAFGLVPRAAIENPQWRTAIEPHLCFTAGVSVFHPRRIQARTAIWYAIRIGPRACLVGVQRIGPHCAKIRAHLVRLCSESPRNRKVIERSIGGDPYIHNGRPAGLFRELCNAFVRSERRPDVREMDRVFRGLRDALPKIMRDAGAKSPFTARVFNELRLLATELADRYAV